MRWDLQQPGVNKDALTVDSCEVLGKLPDPFIADDGHRIRDVNEWKNRRQEMYRTVIELQYGTIPPKPERLEVTPLYRSEGSNIFRITAKRGDRDVSFRLKVILPPKDKRTLCAKNGKPPVIVDGDLSFNYAYDQEWLYAALDEGIGWALFDRTELANDIQNEGRRKGPLYGVYPEYTFGALGAWAWGYSRVVDALEQLEMFDMDCIAFSGHSRGGKTAALAGALDERAAIVNPNATCAGACGCYRLHMTGKAPDGNSGRSETLRDLWDKFDFWLGPDFGRYADDEASLPFDCHELKAMVAPRTLYVSEAAGDFWANPVGSWQTTMAAKEVYRFLGVQDELFWSFRPGPHWHTVGEVQMLASLVRRHQGCSFDVSPFFRLPFSERELIFDWRAPE